MASAVVSAAAWVAAWAPVWVASWVVTWVPWAVAWARLWACGWVEGWAVGWGWARTPSEPGSAPSSENCNVATGGGGHAGSDKLEGNGEGVRWQDSGLERQAERFAVPPPWLLRL